MPIPKDTLKNAAGLPILGSNGVVFRVAGS
jgi:hypothetical protein